MTPTRLLITTSVAVTLALSAHPLLAQAAGATPPVAPPTTGTSAATVTASTVTVPPVPTIKPRESWMADRRNFAVGDIITILIDDYTISTAVKENSASDSRTRGLSVNAKLPTSSKQVGIDSRNNADQQQRGSARRENRFQNEMSVRIVALGPNGLLQLKGTKKIDIDKALQDIVFTGWVRAQDVSTSNVIESSRVADAQLGYTSPGPLGKPKQGIITKVLGAFWP